MSDNIEVVVRVRPLLSREEGDPLLWQVTGEKKNSLMPVGATDKSATVYNFGESVYAAAELI